MYHYLNYLGGALGGVAGRASLKQSGPADGDRHTTVTHTDFPVFDKGFAANRRRARCAWPLTTKATNCRRFNKLKQFRHVHGALNLLSRLAKL